ncbi:MAG: crossover junction endodeoxyribonuclease RuvC [Enterobacteriaceae bacterium]
MAIILGVDPGSRITGYGIVSYIFKKIKHIKSGCIKTKSNNFPNRLKTIYFGISDLITIFNPDCLVIEKVFYSKNISSAFKLCKAFSAALLAASNLNIPIFEYEVKRIKRIVTGIGTAKKKYVKKVVKKILKTNFKKNNFTNDVSDALSVAIAHIFYKLRNNK